MAVRWHVIPDLLRDYLAPEAVDSVYQEVARFSKAKRAAQPTDEYPARPDQLRHEAEPRMQVMGVRGLGLSGHLRTGHLSRSE